MALDSQNTEANSNEVTVTTHTTPNSKAPRMASLKAITKGIQEEKKMTTEAEANAAHDAKKAAEATWQAAYQAMQNLHARVQVKGNDVTTNEASAVKWQMEDARKELDRAKAKYAALNDRLVAEKPYMIEESKMISAEVTEAVNENMAPAMKAEEEFEMWETNLAMKNATLLAAWSVFLDTYVAAKEAAGLAQDSAEEANAAGYELAVSDYCVPALDVVENDGVVTVTENLAYRELHDEEADMDTLQDEVRTKWLATQVQDAPSGAMAEYTEAQNRLNSVLYGD